MRAIRYAGAPVAVVVNGDLAVLAPALDVLGPEDALHRFVGAMCRLAMELELGIAQGAYEDERAEGYSRGC